jgi:hypothetical protein
MSTPKKYVEMFDYLRGSETPTTPEPTVVFGRNDSLVAKAAGNLVLANLADVIVITGGVGKDTSDLLEKGYRSEADYISWEMAADAFAQKYTLPTVLLDELAQNGGENSRNSINLLNIHGYDSSTLNAVAHATSARRLSEMLKKEGAGINGNAPAVTTKPTDYRFDETNPLDQQEARAEMLRLADWPAKDWLLPQVDLPQDLVDFAREEQEK